MPVRNTNITEVNATTRKVDSRSLTNTCNVCPKSDALNRNGNISTTMSRVEPFCGKSKNIGTN